MKKFSLSLLLFLFLFSSCIISAEPANQTWSVGTEDTFGMTISLQVDQKTGDISGRHFFWTPNYARLDTASMESETDISITGKLREDSSSIGDITLQSSRAGACKITLFFLADGSLYGILNEYPSEADRIIPNNFLLYQSPSKGE